MTSRPKAIQKAIQRARRPVDAGCEGQAADGTPSKFVADEANEESHLKSLSPGGVKDIETRLQGGLGAPGLDEWIRAVCDRLSFDGVLSY